MTESIYQSKVWKELGTAHFLSKRHFIVMLTLWTLFGTLISMIASAISITWQISFIGFICLFILSFLGIKISTLDSKNIFINLTGYIVMTSALGLILGPVLALYTTASIIKIMAGTALVVVCLGSIGIIYPKSLEHWSSYLIGALWILLIGLLVVPIAAYFNVPINGALTILDWLGLILFSILIIYDLNRAMRVERTHITALECAIGIYLDFINIFIKLLSLFGVKTGKD